MIETQKTKGFIHAYIEWWPVNEKTHIDKDGEYIYINDFWIHPDFRNNGIIRRFINVICEKNPQAKYGYWKRAKYKGRKSIYRRFNIYERRKNA